MQIEGINVSAAAADVVASAARPGVRGGAAAPKPAAPAKPAPAAPKTYNVKVEFLDKGGNVVDTQTGTVGPVGPGDRKTARFESNKPGIVAFRYASMT